MADIDLSAIRALRSLDLSRNELRAESAEHVAEAIKGHVSALRFFWYHFELDLTSGSTAVVYGYSYYNTTKGALTSLNVSSNNLVSYKYSKEEYDYSGIKFLAAAIPECK